MAARAGALNQAERSAMRNAFARAMTPLHIGRAESSHFETTFLTKALPDSRLNTRLEILEDPAETGLLHLKALTATRCACLMPTGSLSRPLKPPPVSATPMTPGSG